MLGEDVGSRADFCSCKICIHAIPGERSAVKLPPSAFFGRATPHLNPVRMLKLGISERVSNRLPDVGKIFIIAGFGAFRAISLLYHLS